jgi:BolA protein
MSIQDRIIEKLDDAFELAHLEVVNESAGHNVPPGSETHFKVVLVAEAFSDQRLLNRHRAVNAVLAEELSGGVHALALHTYAPDEWKARFGDVPMSPPCLGGGRKGAAP